MGLKSLNPGLKTIVPFALSHRKAPIKIVKPWLRNIVPIAFTGIFKIFHIIFVLQEKSSE